MISRRVASSLLVMILVLSLFQYTSIAAQKTPILVPKHLFDEYYETLIRLKDLLGSITSDPHAAVENSTLLLDLVRSLPDDPENVIKPMMIEIASRVANITASLDNLSTSTRELSLANNVDERWVSGYCDALRLYERINSTLALLDEDLISLAKLNMMSAEGNMSISFGYITSLCRNKVSSIQYYLNGLRQELINMPSNMLTEGDLLISSSTDNVLVGRNVTICGVVYRPPFSREVLLYINGSSTSVEVTPYGSFTGSFTPRGEGRYVIYALATLPMGNVSSNVLDIHAYRLKSEMRIDRVSGDRIVGGTIRLEGELRDELGRPLNGTIIVHLNGTYYDSLACSNGTFDLELNPRASGLYRINLSYMGDLAHEPSNLSYDVMVTRIPTNITLHMERYEVGSNESLGISGILATDEGIPLKGRKIYIYSDEELLGTSVTNESGKFMFEARLPEGSHTIYAVFKGDPSYNASVSTHAEVRVFGNLENTTSEGGMGNISGNQSIFGNIPYNDVVIIALLVLVAAIGAVYWSFSRRRRDEGRRRIKEMYSEAEVEMEEKEGEEKEEGEIKEEHETATSPGTERALQLEGMHDYYSPLKRSDTLLFNGNYRGAVINEYIAFLRLINAKPNQTPKEVLREIEDPIISNDLEKVTSLFERVVYGDKEIARDDAIEFLLSMRRIYLWMYLNYSSH